MIDSSNDLLPTWLSCTGTLICFLLHTENRERCLPPSRHSGEPTDWQTKWPHRGERWPFSSTMWSKTYKSTWKEERNGKMEGRGDPRRNSVHCSACLDGTDSVCVPHCLNSEPNPLLTSCGSLGKSLNLSGPGVSNYQMEEAEKLLHYRKPMP